MNVVVCIKQVPDTTEVRIDEKTGTLIRDGVPSIMNPDDKVGLEAALKLKDTHNAHVTVLTMGPAQAEKMLKEAMAMGADRAILLTDRAFAGSDTLATSTALAAAIAELDYDLIITGRQAIDGDTAQVGTQIAEKLDIANISYAQAIKIEEDGKHVVVERQFEGYYQVQRTALPCLITAIEELGAARYMTPGGILDAYTNREIEVWNVDKITVDMETLGLKGSPTKVKKTYTKTLKPAGVVLELEGAEAAQAIVKKLKESFIL